MQIVSIDNTNDYVSNREDHFLEWPNALVRIHERLSGNQIYKSSCSSRMTANFIGYRWRIKSFFNFNIYISIQWNNLSNDYLIATVTPIELPSDEEIGKDIGSGMHDFYKGGFIEGAKWMKEQILNQNK